MGLRVGQPADDHLVSQHSGDQPVLRGPAERQLGDGSDGPDRRRLLRAVRGVVLALCEAQARCSGARMNGGGVTVAMVLTGFGFVAPFVVLFSRWVKRKRFALGLVALWALAVRMLDLYWGVIPSFERAGSGFQWLDVILVLGIGALWVGYFLHRLASRPLLPANDPRLEGVVQHG